MKFKVTKKEMRENCLLFRLSYCDASNYAEIFGNPVAYSCGMYGWDCDYYQLKGEGVQLWISEGYRPTSNASSKEQEAFRRLYDKTIKAYKKEVEKAEEFQGGWLHSEQFERLGKRYRKRLLKGVKAIYEANY